MPDIVGAGPGEPSLARTLRAFFSPYRGSKGCHGTAAATEFAVLKLHVRRSQADAMDASGVPLAPAC